VVEFRGAGFGVELADGEPNTQNPTVGRPTASSRRNAMQVLPQKGPRAASPPLDHGIRAGHGSIPTT